MKTRKSQFSHNFVLFLSSIFLFCFNSFAADQYLQDQEFQEQEEEVTPCASQKKIWAGFRETNILFKVDEYKNIFIVGDQTVVDLLNELEWKICAEGQQFLQGRCLGTANLMTWNEAPEAVENQLYAGKNDWRVPTIDELETIVDYCTTSGGYFNEQAFPETEPGIFWTSSHDPGFYNEYVAWYVDFASATSTFLDKERLGRVRAVRDYK